MGFRLKTSKKTREIFEEVGASSNLKPFALSKIAIALSLKDTTSIDLYEETDTNGLELQRSTVTGEFDNMYKSLMEVNLNKHLTDDQYYPLYTKKHIDKGAEILYKDYKYSGGNLEKFLDYLINDKKGGVKK
ncbi:MULTISPECIES: DndE family protein [unclassified Clostridium]|uniref:DndE family protein n=1 Tax=Clostridium TaxID=1485 RepID=UPI001C8C184C|nr:MULTISPECIES: DndE family protein [unclassified Clostridium]MBX9138876.1 DndE family protein [Clostridium sp. K12(2020)]MBX9145642.1 DndE family protein [Clostridium sp. K13]